MLSLLSPPPQGNIREALLVVEQSLVLRTQAFGPNHPAVLQACKTLGELCNLQAINDLSAGEFDACLELLKKATVLTEQHPLVRAVTYNNFSCYYRRYGSLDHTLRLFFSRWGDFWSGHST
jgi:hypothetical protein